jgi:hypothetical protein|nr:MAG TPA: hypothetical protein [Caudoviricetes sp.]
MARQITFYKYEVGIQSLEKAEDGRYDLVHNPVGIMEDTSLTKTDIRKFIIANGIECKRGAEVYSKKVAKVVYKFTTEKLLEVADSREELPLDE